MIKKKSTMKRKRTGAFGPCRACRIGSTYHTAQPSRSNKQTRFPVLTNPQLNSSPSSTDLPSAARYDGAMAEYRLSAQLQGHEDDVSCHRHPSPLPLHHLLRLRLLPLQVRRPRSAPPRKPPPLPEGFRLFSPLARGGFRSSDSIWLRRVRRWVWLALSLGLVRWGEL
jgi:hypothetical protein